MVATTDLMEAEPAAATVATAIMEPVSIRPQGRGEMEPSMLAEVAVEIGMALIMAIRPEPGALVEEVTELWVEELGQTDLPILAEELAAAVLTAAEGLADQESSCSMFIKFNRR